MSKMKTFRVYYNFDIRSHETDLVVESGRGTFDIQVAKKKDIDFGDIKNRIAKIAQDSKSNSMFYTGYSNYYRIEEVK